MQTGHKIRALSNATAGDFLRFELLVEGRWREVRVSGTALAVLDKGGSSSRLAIFVQHMETIIRAAKVAALADLDAPFILLAQPL
ncbi:MAG: hypothetical protein AB1807_15740 [Pseudomonadota bacterium]